jgi:hypothetical protein
MLNARTLGPLLAALLLLLLVGCGSPENATTPSREPAAPATSPTAPQTNTQAPPTAPQRSAILPAPTATSPQPGQDTPLPAATLTAPVQTTPASAESPLKRHDTPPKGVAAHQAKEYGTLGFTCQALPDDSLGLRITIYEAEHEVADGFSFCFSGFARDQPIQVQVTRPDRTVEREEVPAIPPFGPEALDWVTLPSDPLGEYNIIAAQGAHQATGSFTLRAASKPRMVVFRKDGPLRHAEGPPGTTFQIALAGFQPNTRVLLHLYQSGTDADCPSDLPDCWAYRTSLPPVQVDASGQAINALNTQPDDDGYYRLVPELVAVADGLDSFYVDRDNPAPDVTLVAGQQAVTRPPLARDLWAAPTGDQRVADRPKLYGGAVVTILAVEANAVQIRTEENVEGWIREPAAKALTSHLEIHGERARFVPQVRVQIVWPNGIPLRSEPRPDAAKLLEQIKAGQQATLQELRGDWLRIVLDDGTTGWARWYYDGTVYIDVLPQR